MVGWLTRGRFEEQLRALGAGFSEVLPQHATWMLRPEDLQTLLVGNEQVG
jgi:hypothetical protein